MSESKKKQNELMSQVKELQATNQSLNEIAKKTQESLEKEQAVIKCYQESPGGKVHYLLRRKHCVGLDGNFVATLGANITPICMS